MARKLRAYTEIGKRIAALGKRQKHIARVLGIEQNAVSNRLRGKSAIPVSELEKLSKAYKVPMTYFFEEECGNPVLAAALERILSKDDRLQDLVVLASKLQPSDQKKLLEIAKTLTR